MWWPHTEALCALLLAHRLTAERWCMEWYWRVHDWSFAHFPMPEAGEWRQRLDRQGGHNRGRRATGERPFHLPRAVMLKL